MKKVASSVRNSITQMLCLRQLLYLSMQHRALYIVSFIHTVRYKKRHTQRYTQDTLVILRWIKECCLYATVLVIKEICDISSPGNILKRNIFFKWNWNLFYCECLALSYIRITSTVWYHSLNSSYGTSGFAHHCFCKCQHKWNVISGNANTNNISMLSWKLSWWPPERAWRTCRHL